MLSQIFKAFVKAFGRAGSPFRSRSQQPWIDSDRLPCEFIVPANPKLGLRNFPKIPFVRGKYLPFAPVIHSVMHLVAHPDNRHRRAVFQLVATLSAHRRREIARKLPGSDSVETSIILLISTMPWPEIFGALREINFQGSSWSPDLDDCQYQDGLFGWGTKNWQHSESSAQMSRAQHCALGFRQMLVKANFRADQ